jgi:hypothetical protein
VRYLSADHVYLDSGSQKGLAVGMKVQLVRGSKVFAELEVVYAAGHSASCRVIHQDTEIKAGDSGVFEADTILPETQVVSVPDSLPRARSRQTWKSSGPQTAIKKWDARGSMALQWDHSSDGNDRELQTDLISVPFSVRIQNPDSHWKFRARGSFRHILREGFSVPTPTGEWRNRIREVSLAREDRKLAWNFAMGRISSKTTASAGPFDGLNVSRKMSDHFRLGGFAGFSPRWEDYGFSTDDRVTGLNLNFERYSAGGNRLGVILAGIGRYHKGEVSREYMVLTSTWSNPSGLSLLQSAELDFNRKWRKDAENVSTVELSSIALTGRYRLNRSLTFNMGFDDRQPVRTWETKSLPDSLFTDAGRRGLRAGMNVRFSKGRSFNFNASTRSDERSGDNSTSWNGRFYLPDFPVAGVSTNVSLRGFSGPWLSGLAPTLGLRKAIRSGLALQLDGGHYAYSGPVDGDDRSNNWMKVSASKDLSRRWSLAADYRHDWGSDMAGQRWFLEMRYRF